MYIRLKFLSASMFAIVMAVAAGQPAHADVCVADEDCIQIVSNTYAAPPGFTLTIAQQPPTGIGSNVPNTGFVDVAFDLVTGGSLAQGLDVDVSAPPWLGAGPDPYEYLAAEPNNPITVEFATAQTSFDMIWGSVDAYNTLIFYDAGGNVLGSFAGCDINCSAGGNQGYEGSNYVDFDDTDSTDPIAYIGAYSGSPAFEFDYSEPSSPGAGTNLVPEPLTLSLLGAGLVGAAALRRRKRKSVSVSD